LTVDEGEDRNLSSRGIDDPVLADPGCVVELELCLAVAAHILCSWGEDLDDQLRSDVELAIGLEALAQSRSADPNEIRDDVVVVGQDQAGRVGESEAGLPTP